MDDDCFWSVSLSVCLSGYQSAATAVRIVKFHCDREVKIGERDKYFPRSYKYFHFEVKAAAATVSNQMEGEAAHHSPFKSNLSAVDGVQSQDIIPINGEQEGEQEQGRAGDGRNVLTAKWD